MVRTRNRRIGLCVGTDGLKAKVCFVQNGRISTFWKGNLIRATREQVEASHLKGVGCNQAYD
jgi:hypothetical protein